MIRKLHKYRGSITQIRNQKIKNISSEGEKTKNQVYHFVPWKRRSKTCWAFLQLLSGQDNPKSVLFLGVTMGNDIVGAVENDLRVCVVDSNLEILNIMSKLSQSVKTISFSQKYSINNEYFDIVYITPWWISTCKQRGMKINNIIDEACNHLQIGGNLLIHMINDSIFFQISQRIFSKNNYQVMYRNLYAAKFRKVQAYLKILGFNLDMYLIKKDPTMPRELLAINANKDIFFEKIRIDKQKNEKNTLRKNLLRIYLKLNFPKGIVYPWIFISANKTHNNSKQKYFPHYLKTASLTLSSIGYHNGDVYYIRHDTGNKKILYEKDILSYLFSNNIISGMINPPTAQRKIGGLDSVLYKYIHGRELGVNDSEIYSKFAFNFLINLSNIVLPDFLDNGYDYFHRSIVGSRNYYKGSKFYHLLANGLVALTRLKENNVFNWIAHGDFRPNNLRISLDNKQIFIMDWVYSHIGHPIMDYWSFLLFYRTNLPETYPTPKELLNNLDSKNLDDLWCLWQANRVVRV